MQDQLSLFPQDKTAADQRQEEFEQALESNLSAVDELVAIAGRCTDAREYADLLAGLIRFPQYSIFNGLLLYLQNPRASRVATAAGWMRRHRRRPRPDARPLIILAPMAPVLFVYDISDTEGAPLTSPPPPAATGGAALREIFENTNSNCALHGICLRQSELKAEQPESVVRLTAATRKRFHSLEPSPKASYLIMVEQSASLQEQYLGLVSALGQIYCGHLGIDANAWWPERAALSAETAEIEQISVAFLIAGRCGAVGTSPAFLDRYQGGGQKLPAFSLNAVVQSAGYIEEMGKSKWTAPRKKSRYKG